MPWHQTRKTHLYMHAPCMRPLIWLQLLLLSPGRCLTVNHTLKSCPFLLLFRITIHALALINQYHSMEVASCLLSEVHSKALPSAKSRHHHKISKLILISTQQSKPTAEPPSPHYTSINQTLFAITACHQPTSHCKTWLRCCSCDQCCSNSAACWRWWFKSWIACTQHPPMHAQLLACHPANKQGRLAILHWAGRLAWDRDMAAEYCVRNDRQRMELMVCQLSSPG